jgi:hypothetical protein
MNGYFPDTMVNDADAPIPLQSPPSLPTSPLHGAPLPTNASVGMILQKFDFKVPDSPLPILGRYATPAMTTFSPMSTPFDEKTVLFSPMAVSLAPGTPASEKLDTGAVVADAAPPSPPRKEKLGEKLGFTKVRLDKKTKGRSGSEVRRPSIGPDVSLARLGSPSKRGFDKVEIRSWLLDARRDSAVSASGGD